MKAKSIAIAVISGLLVLPVAANACDLCQAYNPQLHSAGVSSSDSLDGTASKGMFAGLSHRFTHYESNVRQDGFTSFPGQHLESNITQIIAGGELMPSTVMQFNLPFITRSYRRVVDRSVDKGSETGIGDAVAQLRYMLPQVGQSCASDGYTLHTEVNAGLKLPTGDSGRLGEEREEVTALRHGTQEGSLVGGDDLALGSGSFDPILGAKAVLDIDPIFFSAHASYAFRQPGDHDYAYGAGIDWGAGTGATVLSEGASTLLLSAELSGEYKSRDRLAAHEVSGSEDRRIFLGPQLTYIAADSISLATGVDFPLYTESAADSVVPHYRLNASLVGRF